MSCLVVRAGKNFGFESSELPKGFCLSTTTMSTPSSCCPSGSWGELKNPNYVAKGQVDEVDGLSLYRVGNSSKCIIWNYDIFGFEGGRSRQMADFLADNGYMVIMPDYYRGKMKDPFASPGNETVEFLIQESNWSGQLKGDWENIILPYSLKNGAKTFGTIGTCWGTYVVVRLASYVEMKAGVSLHPSHSPVINMLGENEEQILKEIKSPQMFMPADNDDPNVMTGGLGKKILGDGLEIIEFPEMAHGWTVRGDLSKPEVERDVKKAFNFVLAFFGKYLH